jgi:hypothetical protein
MPHIALSPDLPGIRGAMAFRPEMARPLNALVEVLLTGLRPMFQAATVRTTATAFTEPLPPRTWAATRRW